MKVIEIFDSIDGEGIRTGQCATFIRLAGCNLRCSYCDTVYSLFGEETPCEYTEMTVDEIISKVNMTYKRVTLTGGEPLVIKFVIGSDEDMNLTIDIVKKLKQVYTEMPHIYLGAVYGMYDAQKLVNIMLKEPVLCDATFQIQLHKVIWDPEERGV